MRLYRLSLVWIMQPFSKTDEHINQPQFPKYANLRSHIFLSHYLVSIPPYHVIMTTRLPYPCLHIIPTVLYCQNRNSKQKKKKIEPVLL